MPAPSGTRAPAWSTNATRHAAGTSADFWNYEPEGGVGWYRYGQGRVNPKETHVLPDAQIGVYKFTMSSYFPPTAGAPPPVGPPPGNIAGTDLDPVDLSTGLLVLTKTDMVVPGVVPITLQRTYRPGDPVVREFGVGMTHPYAMFVITPTGLCESWT